MVSASHRFGIDIHNASTDEKDKTRGENLWKALAINAGKIKENSVNAEHPSGELDTDGKIDQTEFIHVVTEKWRFNVEI